MFAPPPTLHQKQSELELALQLLFDNASGSSLSASLNEGAGIMLRLPDGGLAALKIDMTFQKGTGESSSSLMPVEMTLEGAEPVGPVPDPPAGSTCACPRLATAQPCGVSVQGR